MIPARSLLPGPGSMTERPASAGIDGTPADDRHGNLARRRRSSAARCCWSRRSSICIDITLRYTLVVDGRRRRRAVRLCAGDRQRLGLLGGAADALAHPHRHGLCARAAAACRAMLDLLSLAALRVLHRAGHLARAGACCGSPTSPDSHSLSEIETPLVVPQALWVAGPRLLRRGCAAAAGARAHRLRHGRPRPAVRADRLEVGRGGGRGGDHATSSRRSSKERQP